MPPKKAPPRAAAAAPSKQDDDAVIDVDAEVSAETVPAAGKRARTDAALGAYNT